MIEEFQAIEALLSPYLHQDWDTEFDSAEDAISAALKHASDEELKAAIEQMLPLIELVSLARNELELTSLFVRLGINYHPRGDGLEDQAWLEQTRLRMIDEADKRR